MPEVNVNSKTVSERLGDFRSRCHWTCTATCCLGFSARRQTSYRRSSSASAIASKPGGGSSAGCGRPSGLRSLLPSSEAWKRAGGVGFEPTGACTPAAFKAAAIDHSANPPRVLPVYHGTGAENTRFGAGSTAALRPGATLFGGGGAQSGALFPSGEAPASPEMVV